MNSHRANKYASLEVNRIELETGPNGLSRKLTGVKDTKTTVNTLKSSMGRRTHIALNTTKVTPSGSVAKLVMEGKSTKLIVEQFLKKKQPQQSKIQVPYLNAYHNLDEVST